MVDRRDLLGKHDRVVLGHDAHPRAQAEITGAGCRRAEGGELVEQACVLAGTVALNEVAPAHGDMGVLREEQRLEAGRLDERGEIGDIEAGVGEPDGKP